jgi:hypothetical protein
MAREALYVAAVRSKEDLHALGPTLLVRDAKAMVDDSPESRALGLGFNYRVVVLLMVYRWYVAHHGRPTHEVMQTLTDGVYSTIPATV